MDRQREPMIFAKLILLQDCNTQFCTCDGVYVGLLFFGIPGVLLPVNSGMACAGEEVIISPSPPCAGARSRLLRATLNYFLMWGLCLSNKARIAHLRHFDLRHPVQ